MIKKLLIILITLVFLITGCTHRLELSNLNVISSCIYDTDDEGNIILGIESKLPVSSDEDSVSGFKSTTLLSEGKTATEAWDNISNTFAPNLTTALIKVNLFTENFAKESMINVLDFFLRFNEFMENSYVVVVKGDKPDMIYKSYTGLDPTIGDYIKNLSIVQPKNTSSSTFITIFDFISSVSEKGVEAVAGVCELVEKEEIEILGQPSEGEDEEKENKILYEGLAVFKNLNLVGYLDGKETLMYNIVTNKFKSGNICINNQDFDVTAEIINSKTKIKTEYKDNKVVINIYPTFKFSFADIIKGDVISSKENKEYIENALSKLMDEEIHKTISKVQSDYASDIFGFGLLFKSQNSSKFLEIKDDWNEHFKNAQIQIFSKSYLLNTHQTLEPLIKK